MQSKGKGLGTKDTSPTGQLRPISLLNHRVGNRVHHLRQSSYMQSTTHTANGRHSTPNCDWWRWQHPRDLFEQNGFQVEVLTQFATFR